MPGGDATAPTATSAGKAGGQQAASNREFTRALSLALLALLISAAGLTTAVTQFSPELQSQRDSAARENLRPWKISGADLIPRMGQAEETGSERLRITRLERGQEIRGIFSRRTGFKAADYPFLEFQITGRNPTSYYYFIWRTAENPDQVHNIALSLHGGRAGIMLLTQNPAWQGTIIEAGLDVYGDLRGNTPVIDYLTLLPTAEINLLRVIISEWTAFRAWTQISVNTLLGAPERPLVSPTVAIASWAALALALAGLFRLFFPFSLVHTAGGIVLLAWLSLDLLWQRNLSWQLAETKFLFAGKTQHQKHLADREAELYQYAQHLKDNILPNPGVKIYLLHDSEGLNYRRLKTQYYLLPHNIFNYDRLPRLTNIRQGDYLLVLDGIEELSYLPETNQLHWGKRKLNVELLDQHEIGQLYLVRDLK